jgi:Tol biopolymer transport system component
MTDHADFDRTLAGWFEAEALSPAPAGALERVLDATGRHRPRPAWLVDPGSHWVGEPYGTGPSIGARSLPRSGLRWTTALILLLVIAGLVGGAIVVGARLVQPAPLPTGRLSHLAYGLNGDIFVADWDGKNPVRIADGLSSVNPTDGQGFWGEGPIWSPDGRLLAYRSRGGTDACCGTVYISDPAGHVVASFPGTGWKVSWSPDSTRVVTSIDLGHTFGIYGLDGVRQALFALPAGYGPPGDYSPIWSPDGMSLLIDLASLSPSTVGPQVWEIPVDGGAARPVPADDPRSHLAAFSDDGTRAAFTTTLPTVAGGPGVDFYSLVVAQADGNPIRTLIGGQNGSNGPIDGDAYWAPLLSPSGDRVAFLASSGPNDQQATRTYELRVLDVASGTVTSLASSGMGLVIDPIRFSPGGDRILGSRTDANGVSSLWSVQIDGSGAQLLVPGTSWGDWQPVPGP